MKILQIVHGFPPESIAGTETYCETLSRHLLARGHECEVLTGSGQRATKATLVTESQEELRVTRYLRAEGQTQSWRDEYDPEAEALIRGLLSLSRPDLVHLHHWHRLTNNLGAICTDLGIPVVVTLHDVWTSCPRIHRIHREGLFCREPILTAPCLHCVERTEWQTDREVAAALALRQQMVQSELSLASALIVPSEAHRSLLLEMLELPENRLIVLPHGSSRAIIAQERRKEPSAFPNRPLQIGHWGYFLYHKGTHLLLEALHRLDDPSAVQVHLIGTASEQAYGDRLHDLARGLSVQFHGAYQPADLQAFDLDLAVFPSITSESYSFTIDEALRLGLPVLVSDRGALSERIGKAGLTFRAEDAEDLARRLQGILDAPEVLDAMRRSIQVESLFSMESNVVMLEKTYKDAVDAAQPKRESGTPYLKLIAHTQQQVRDREQQVGELAEQVRDREQQVRDREQQVRDREQQVQELTEQVRHLQDAQVALDAEVGGLRRQLEDLLSSRSWKLTAPLRRLRAGFRDYRERPRRLWRGGKRGLRVIQELWNRKAYDVSPLYFMVPATVESSGPQSSQEAIHWIPSLVIERQGRTACVTRPPTRIAYRFTVPPRAVIQTFVALLPEAWDQALHGVEFIVSVSVQGSGRSLTRKWLSHPAYVPHHRRWLEARVDLRRFAGQEVELTLSTVIHSDFSDEHAMAVWGDPVILSRKSVREIWALCMGNLALFGMGGLLSRFMRIAYNGEQLSRPTRGGAEPTRQLPGITGNNEQLSPLQQLEINEHSYEAWLLQCSALTNASRALIRTRIEGVKYRPLISVILPVCNAPEESLRSAIESVQNQLYDHWELWLADGSSEPKTARLLEEYCEKDSRIHRCAIDSDLDREHIYATVLAYCRGESTLFLFDAWSRAPFEWLLSAFVLWSVNKCFPTSFPIPYNRLLYHYLVQEEFPFNETVISKELRGLPLTAYGSVAYKSDLRNEMPAVDEPALVLGEPDVRAIAFYLPQFHTIQENDRWWGAGFTEWTNVKRAKPFFKFHDQPRIPTELGYYDLTDPQVRQKQAELAKAYGLAGFCYYHYWFGRGKRLLEGPFREVLESGKPDFPFCLCWANENWTRRWDGLDQEILMKQTYLSGDEVAFIEELIPAFYDSRYIKVDGRPLLVVYSPAKLPDPQKSFAIWRDVARAHGLPDLYLAGVQAFGFEDHRLYGLDADIEFPVHFQVGHDGRNAWGVSRQEQDFQGRILSYFHNKSYGVTRPKPPYTLLKGVMPMWDNTARRMGKGTIFRTRNLTPESYYHWLASTVEYTRTHFVGDERLIFINAWNEWGEGCYLEPDQRVGRSLLRATRRALTQVSGCERSQPTIVDTQRAMEIVFVSHDAARAGAQRLLLTLIEWLRDHRGVQPKIILRRGGVLAQEFHRLGPVLVVESLLQDGPDRLKQEVLRFCGNSASLVYINTLVPGGVAAILAGLQVPMITHVHEMEHAIQRWCDKDQLATLLRLTTRFVAASPPVAYNLETNHGVAASRMTTIYEFIRCSDDNAASIDKAYLRREMGLRNGGPVIFGCGTTDWRKGPDLFIETAHHAVKMGLGNAHFYWIGGNTSITEGEDLAAKIRTLGLENTVTFLGEVLEPRRYFPAGDAFLLTSREDPYPLVCLEAADCGVPIICFEGAGGMPDFVGEDAGYRVPFENTQAMAEKLVALFSHAGLQEQLGARAREKVRSQHDITVTGNQIWQTILEVASEPCDGDSLVGSSAPVGVVRDGPTRS